jgi:hypothetical protein
MKVYRKEEERPGVGGWERADKDARAGRLLPAYEGGMVAVGEAASEARKQSEIV